MKRTALLVAFLLCASFGVTGAQTPSTDATPVVIGGGAELLWYEYHPDPDFPRLIGEISNTLNQPIATPAVNLVFTDDDENVYGTSLVTPLLPTLDPGQSIGITAYMSEVAEGWTIVTAYACTWSFDYDANATSLLQVEDFQTPERSSGFWDVEGWVVNNGPTDVPLVTVVVEARDPATGRFIGSTSASIDAPVPAGKKGAFSYFIGPFDMPGWVPGTTPDFVPHPLVSNLSGYGGC